MGTTQVGGTSRSGACSSMASARSRSESRWSRYTLMIASSMPVMALQFDGLAPAAPGILVPSRRTFRRGLHRAALRRASGRPTIGPMMWRRGGTQEILVLQRVHLLHHAPHVALVQLHALLEEVAVEEVL